MTAKEIQKRNKKSAQLKILQTEAGKFYVESAEGKILYNVTINEKEKKCTCGDFAKNNKRDAAFVCKHILAVENSVSNNEIESTTFLEKNTPKLKDIFISNIKGKDFVLYAGVLDLATQKGLLKLEVTLLQFPTKDNGQEAICAAIAEDKNGKVFSDIGDANPGNCTPMIAKHLIRMASTRAKGRALRDMCNIGITCLEEIGDIDDVIPGKNNRKPAQKKTAPKAKPAATKKKAEEKKPEPKVEKETKSTKAKEPVKDSKSEQDEPPMSEAQKRAIFNLSRRRGISVEDLERLVMEDYGALLDNLSVADASSMIRNLQQAA